MDGTSDRARSLALLIDADPAVRSLVRPLLETHGLELVQVRTSVAALELLQRMTNRFRLVLVSLEMPGLSGLVVLETLRLFRPGTATLCLTSSGQASVVAAGGDCLMKPVRASDLRIRIADALAGGGSTSPNHVAPAEVLARARASFAASGSLLEAARELARGLPGEPPGGW